MTLLETMYIPIEGSSRFADLPIATNSIVKVCCMSLWMIVLLVADSWIISESRKTRFLNYLFDGILQILFETQMLDPWNLVNCSSISTRSWRFICCSLSVLAR